MKRLLIVLVALTSGCGSVQQYKSCDVTVRLHLMPDDKVDNVCKIEYGSHDDANPDDVESPAEACSAWKEGQNDIVWATWLKDSIIAHEVRHILEANCKN